MPIVFFERGEEVMLTRLFGLQVPSDATLLRFLRARDFNVEKAREMLSRSLTWRKKHAVDRILSEYQTVPVVKDYFPGGWHHHDKGTTLYFRARTTNGSIATEKKEKKWEKSKFN